MLLLCQCEIGLALLRSNRPETSSTDRIDRGVPVFPPGKSQNTYHFVRPPTTDTPSARWRFCFVGRTLTLGAGLFAGMVPIAHQPKMKIVKRKAEMKNEFGFIHRANPASGFDSICLRCFRIIAT